MAGAGHDAADGELTGLDMLIRFDLWDRFFSLGYWWMHAMVLTWLIFTVMLFVAEPLFLHRRLILRAKVDPEGTFRHVRSGCIGCS